MIQRILCACIGNSDRSPVMAAVLDMFLKNAGHDVVCESAGIDEVARKGKAAPFGLAAAKRIGLDLSEHNRRYVGDIDLSQYDLIVCASDEIAGKMLQTFGADMNKLYTVPVANPWPVKFQRDYDDVMPAILAGMYRVVTHYFS